MEGVTVKRTEVAVTAATTTETAGDSSRRSRGVARKMGEK